MEDRRSTVYIIESGKAEKAFEFIGKVAVAGLAGGVIYSIASDVVRESSIGIKVKDKLVSLIDGKDE